MRGEPMIEVCCDKCGAVEMMGMTALARGAYDERYLDQELERMGWTTGAEDICPECLALADGGRQP